ncbi:MAG: single-stranded-DNA-specific exonuclease RecJ [Thermodesulfovibrionales bacterium]|nr:single-stranded-DNA-specific exonuclease RecJ [Thermodesulfovibrionales bacterium]
MEKRWLVSRTNPEYIRYISKAASISPALSQILINRGLKTPQEINDFLKPGISGLSDPFELPGIKTAVERIKHALDINERILVHGDYDADGLTATAIMVHTLRMHGLDVHYFIPNRIAHGYGFNPAAVKIAKELGAKLIITVDCGITSFEAASYAKAEGIDVIITDHHEPAVSSQANGFSLPDAVAVINPKLSALSSQLSDLSGAGIAFKIAQALATVHGSQFTVHDLLDLAAIGTMADVVPLTGENRIIVREGLKLIHEGRRPGIKALKSIAGLDGRQIRAELLSFTIIPRINAAGRLADSQDVVRLLLSDKEEEALELSSWLDRLNSERQKLDEAVYQEALSRLAAKEHDSVIVLSGEGWHLGVVGIVASRLAEKFYCPAFIFSVENGIAKGSARSIPSFDLCKGLSECNRLGRPAGAGELLLSFGGHKQAAGIKLKAENISDFEKAMQGVIKSSLNKDDFIPCLDIDADITLAEANHNLVKELSMLEPLGCGNEKPFLGSKGLEVINPRIVGNNHLKMRLKQGPQTIDAIGFDMGEPSPPDTIDAVFTLDINEYNGNSYLQLNLKAFRPSR